MRRHSRNHNAAASKKAQQTASAPALPNSPTTSTSRQPLVPQTNLNFSSSQSSITSDGSRSGSSEHGSSHKSLLGRPRDIQESSVIAKATPAGRSERSNTVSSIREGNSGAMSMAGQSSSQRSAYASHPDLYTHNALNSFSFGAATSTSSKSLSIDPLSPRDDADSEEYRFKADTTPRPSLAGPSSHLPPNMPDPLSTIVPPSPRSPNLRLSPQHRRRRNSAASTNTFGTSSASASATSLSSNPRGGSVTTPHTSANEFTSDDEDDQLEHHHPFTPNDYPSSSDSDEEFDDYDERDDSDPEIDVSSEIHEDVDRLSAFHNPSRDSFQSGFPRKGSLAVPIPSPSIFEGRDREDSVATLRRPSRSLEDLKSDSLAQAQLHATRYGENRPVPQAPTSMPESDVDWRDLRRRSIQKEQDRARENQSQSATQHGSTARNETPLSSTTAPGTSQTSVLDGFDSTWNINPATGIVDLDWDQSELADIVGGFQGPRTAERSFRRNSSSTTDSGRRLSTTSINSDPFTRHLNKWGGQQYLDERAKWTFSREKADRAESHRMVNDRERTSISSLFNSHSSSFSGSSSIIGSSTNFHDQIAPFRDRIGPKEKDKSREPGVWKGMAIDAEEWWSSYSNGRYKVVRKSMPSNESGKPPQQRLNISHHRTPYVFKRDACDGPTVTIHKHSKAVGFSISRHYRAKAPSSSQALGRVSTSSRATLNAPATVDKKKPSSMILLAARKVQEAYTSTTTTRKLESHGLLNENGRQSARDVERLERLERERREKKKKEAEREKQRLKELKKQEARRNKEKAKASKKSRGEVVADSSESSTGSVSNDHSTSSQTSSYTSSHSSSSLHPPISSVSRPSIDYSVMSHETNSSGRTIVWNGRRGSEDILDDDDDDPVLPKPPGRTPHGETYATLPPEAFETYALQQENHSSSFFPWNKNRGNSILQRHIHQSYNPPWAVAHNRNYGDRKGIVEDLNTSFQDVGLLPAVDEQKSSSQPSKRKRYQQSETKSSSSKHTVEPPSVFHSFSSEYLYMLLPLWPGETDFISAQKHPFHVPFIPVEERQYLLIYYKPDDVPPPETEKGKGVLRESKKRSRTSPTSSRDSVGKAGEKYVLYDKFHFCARIVTYSDIQGSGVRSPDAGLSVLGPLQDAYDSMPTHALIDTFQVIGVCSSREKGIEFVPEGLEKLGLTRRIPDPTFSRDDTDDISSLAKFSMRSIEEQDEPSDSILTLTPIGRAVVEMAWLGAMALTSFGPGV
ncbi:hypothetical protein CC1G_04520 [Coprinopsis cinerea okayama7|uniref:Uncharacterized protein n=1 Tax=Coprinopsis cinerea (strain Okayama-7 / 130 / ATCC MYA-4618 / FGSC 9003) TaxID=240176 RepID=A8N5E2_COPC7|nr:hypothetical protein CC1G_04520 [Coprinopsis cinerea okayama7\|eukprot:XP_001830087.2 hypothetical protein CC1G_04520 [Coprinopsis cinerea okayama7\